MTDNALDRASFYVEELKYGPGPRSLEPATREELVSQLDALLRAANVGSITGAELDDALDFYAESWARLLGAPAILTKSLFTDGLMHGLALAAGLESTRERLDALEREPPDA